MKENILVTGGTGFVGSFVVEDLLKKGYRVTALVRDKNNLKWLTGLTVDLLEGSLSTVPELPDSITHVIHLAGITKALCEEDYVKGNVDITQNLLSAVSKLSRPITRFLYVSSQAAAGPSIPGQARRESDPPDPVTWYGRSKLQAEKLVADYGSQFPVTIIRPPAVYGPRDKDVLNIFKFIKMGINLTIGKGNQPVSMVYVKNLSHGILTALFHPDAAGQTYFIADGEARPMNDIVALIAESMNKKYLTLPIPLSFAQIIAYIIEKFSGMLGKVSILNRQKMIEVSMPSWALNIEKSRRELGYIPLFTPEEAIRETTQWYRQYKWL